MSTTGQGSPLGTTYEGYVATTYDALILFEACLSGYLNHVPRRPHDRERENLIRSGAIFIYEEHSSGIKRWTDGYNWSPSRILGNFLIYRELEGPFPPGEKKRARKPNNKKQGAKNETTRTHAMMNAVMGNGNTPLSDEQQRQQEELRLLVGSLIDSYQFKMDGLVKKTISITWQGVSHHLVSYYSCEDVLNKRLTTPSTDPKIRNIQPRSQLYTGQNFRSPVSDDSMIGQLQHNGPLDPHGMPHGFAPAGFLQAGMPHHPHHHPQQMIPGGWGHYPGHAPASFDLHVAQAGLGMAHGGHFGPGHDFASAYNQSHHRASVSGPVTPVPPMDSGRRHSTHMTLPIHYEHGLAAGSLSAPSQNHESNHGNEMSPPSHEANPPHHGLAHSQPFSNPSEFAYSAAPTSFVGESLLSSAPATGPTAPSSEFKTAEFGGHTTDGMFAGAEPFKTEGYSQQLQYGNQTFSMN